MVSPLRALGMVRAVDQAGQKLQSDGRRKHLGGSLVGRPCLRELWYNFRWAAGDIQHSGRLLRLFDRGHLEEFRFVQYLKNAGMEVRPFAEALMARLEETPNATLYDYVTVSWESDLTALIADGWEEVSWSMDHVLSAQTQGIELTQYRVQDYDGHFGGSLDGIIRFIPEVFDATGIKADVWGLLELKTHGEKSFTALAGKRKWDRQTGDWSPRVGGKGLYGSKRVHYAQMQVYMEKKGLRYGLYIAVCKDTDEWYAEFVLPDKMVGAGLLSKAREVIFSKEPPNRVSESASWHECTFCDFKQQCHYGASLAKSCRTCTSATPVQNGEWHCSKHSSIIPHEFTLKGCEEHEGIVCEQQ